MPLEAFAKRTYTTLAIGFVSAGLTFQGSPAQAAPPASGSLTWEITSTDPDGIPMGPKKYRRLWFDKTHTRSEETDEMGLASMYVHGESRWVGNPGMRRYEVWHMGPPDDADRLPYPESVRRQFESLSRGQDRTESRAPDGRRAWYFSQLLEQDPTSCLSPPTRQLTFFVNPDPDFPVNLQTTECTSYSCTTTRLTQMGLNSSQPASRFIPPPDWSKVRYLALPAAPFQIDFRVVLATKTGDPRNPFNTHTAVQSFRRDGKDVTDTVTWLDDKGNTLPAASPTDSQRTFLTSKLPEIYTMGHMPPPSAHPTQLRRETMLGLPVEVYGFYSRERGKQTYWIAEHPTLGTIVLRHRTEYPSESTDITVTKVDLEAKSPTAATKTALPGENTP